MRGEFQKRFWTSFLLSAVLLGGSLSSAETIGRIVAIVNDEIITQEDLEEMLLELPEGGARRREIRHQKGLERLIEKRLILQKAEELEIFVTEEEVDAVVQRVKDRFASPEVFEAALWDSGLTYKSFRARHRDQLIVRIMVAREVRSKVRVTPRVIKRYYEDHPDDFQSPGGWELSQILVRKKVHGKKDPVAKELIIHLRERIASGEDFSELVKQFSEGPSKEEGGSLGYIERGKLMAEIEEILTDLSVGEISTVIETATGYNLFRLDDEKGPMTKKLKEVKEKIRKRLLSEKIKNRYETWIAELKKDAYIKQ